MSTNDSRSSSTQISLREMILWSTVSLAAQVSLLAAFGYPRLVNDSFQYLSTARNIATGVGVFTDLPFFDVERQHGVVPAPLTTFPAGFPFVTALVHTLGLPLEHSGAAVALVSSALTVGLLGAACRSLGISGGLTRLAMFGFAANSHTLFFAGTVSTESLFTTLVLASVFALLRVDGSRSLVEARCWALAAGIPLGLCYWIRYAGLLIVGGLVVALCVSHLVQRRRQKWDTVALALIPAFVSIGLGFARNIRLTGSWQGGNTKVVVPKPIAETAWQTIVACSDLLAGLAVSPLARASQVAMLVCVLLLVPGSKRQHPLRRLTLAGVVAGVYAALMFHLGRTTVISYGARMLYPIAPLVILQVVWLANSVQFPSRSRGFALSAAACYLMCGLQSVSMLSAAPQRQDRVAAKLAMPTDAGTPLNEWLEARLSPNEPLIASDGQVTGYVLHRPVVGLVESEYSEQRWDERSILSLMETFHSRYLLLYRQAEGGAALVQEESLFLSALLHNPRNSPRLRPAASNSAIAVFERRSDEVGTVRPGSSQPFHTMLGVYSKRPMQ